MIILWFGACVVEGWETNMFFRIPRLQDDVRGPKQAKKFVVCLMFVRTLIILKKSFKSW